MGFPKEEMLCHIERLCIGVGSLEDFNIIYGYNLKNTDDLKGLYFQILGEYKQWQVEQTSSLFVMA